MKFKKIKTLNEAVADISDVDYSVVNHTYANAIRQNKVNKERIEKAFEERNIQMPNEDREAHSKNLGNTQMKKMYLSESLFTEWVEDPEKVLDNSFYEVRFDEDANNMNDTFDTEEKAIEYAKENLSEGPVVYFVDEYGNEEIVWEMEEEALTESFAQAQLKLKDGQYDIDDSGKLFVSKNVFDDYMQNKSINVEFIDEAAEVMEYKMISEDDHYIVMEYVGEAVPGIDEEVADCQKYPVEKPEAKDSTYVSAEDKQPKNKVEVKNSQYVSASDKQPEKAAMKEDFTNWDSPESRVERYFTDLPQMLMVMQEHYDAGRIAADELAKALKVAYDALDSVPQIDEALEASQKYPIEKPKAKDSQFISAEDKTPSVAVDAKNSEFVSAQDKMPNEANKIEVKESFLVETDEKEEEGVYIYKSKRDPLADIIQVELTEGEWGYVKYPDGRVSPTRLPSANYLDDRIGADWDKNDKYGITVLGESADDLQKAINIAVKYGKEYRLEHLPRPTKSGLKTRIWIYVDEEKDFDEPYFDPNVETVAGKKEDEALEASQKYPVKSPIEKKDSEFISKEDKYPVESPITEDFDDDLGDDLREIRITTEGLGNFHPYGEEAKATWDIIESNDKVATFEFMLEDMFPNGVGSNQLNDLLKSERDWILSMLNISDTDAVEETETLETSYSEVDDDFDM